MNRVERRRRVADLVTRHIVDSCYRHGQPVRAYALPEKGIVVVENEEHRVEHHDIRFCCPEHCYHDIEMDAAAQLLDQFRYFIRKTLKMNDPPEHPDL